MIVKSSTCVNLESSSEKHQNERTPSPPPRKKSLSPPNAPLKSTSSKSTYHTSSSSLKLSPQIISPHNPYVSIVDNWPPGPSKHLPPPRFSLTPPGFEHLQPPPPLFVNMNNKTPQLENHQNLPSNLGNQDFPNPPNNILDFIHPNDMPHLHNMFFNVVAPLAEYVSAGKACQQALWMKQELVNYDIKLNDIPVLFNNKGFIDLSKYPVLYSRTKHIEICHHVLRDNVQKGNIFVEKDNILILQSKWCICSPNNTAYSMNSIRCTAIQQTHTTWCMTWSSTKELLTPFENPKQVLRSRRKLFDTPSLMESNSPEFDQLTEIEWHIEKEEGQFLKELRDNTFNSLEHEDANENIKKVLEIVDLFRITKVTQDQSMLRAFPVSLTGAASSWLRNQPSGLITTWVVLKTKFLNKYCPPAHTAQKMEEINNFQQEPDESLFRAWERFKEFLMKAAGPGFYQRNNGNSLYPPRRDIMEESLFKFMVESAKRHEDNLTIIKEIQASTDAAIQNQRASFKTLELQIRQMSKVLQERGFGCLPSSTEANSKDQVKSISTATADLFDIQRMETSPYVVSVPQHIYIFPKTVPFPRRLHNYCCDDSKEAHEVKILDAIDHNLP
uniref:Retrotransposon protein n=1 Tax=Tanacetum cinerariifolium TaxID=118510 RepID=A0A6L2NL82_TANCI|nr:retrotransposon protein [Tanacetum cinerariifolium]